MNKYFFTALILMLLFSALPMTQAHESPWQPSMGVTIDVDTNGNYIVVPSNAPATVSGDTTHGGIATLQADLPIAGVRLRYCKNLVFDGDNHLISNVNIGVYCYITHGVTIKNLQIAGVGGSASKGILVDQGGNTTVQNCVVTKFGDGMFLGSVVDVSNNDIEYCYQGLEAGGVNAKIYKNLIENNNIGIDAGGASAEFYNNTIENNSYSGVYFTGTSSGTKFYNNFFINNTKQAAIVSSNPGIVYWDAGYPTGGNYWDTYMGADSLRGPKQDQPGSDGIGDTPYLIKSPSGISSLDIKDNYPLMPRAADLSIVDVNPIQVVHDPKILIANKKAALEVLVQSTFTKTVYADFNVTYDFGTKTYLEKGPGLNGVPLAPGENVVYIAGGPASPITLKPWMDPDKGDYLIWTKTGQDNKIKVTVDPEKKTGDTDTSNNVYTLSEKVEESKKLSILVVPIYFPHLSPKSQNTYTIDFQGQMKYLQSILPVSDDKFSWVPKTQAIAWPETPATGYTAEWMKTWLYCMVVKQLTATVLYEGYDKLVVVVKDLPPFTNEVGGIAIGMTRSPRSDVPVVVNYAELGNEGITAHEIAHTYYLWHPFDYGPDKANSQRYDVSARDYGKYMANLMSYDAPPRWIDEGRYESNPEATYTYTVGGKTSTVTGYNLMSQFKTGADPAVIIASGTLFSNSTARVDDQWYVTDSSAVDLTLGAKGNYSFVMLDQSGKKLGSAGFNSSFTLIDEGSNGLPAEVQTDMVPFVLKIPYLQGTKVVELRDSSDKVLAKKNISANAPSVTLKTPGGGEALTAGDVTSVFWDSGDVDGDKLTYTLSFSPDNGISWVPVAFNLKDKSYSWNTTDLTPGNYKLRVEANDGFNTASSTSGAFTIKSLPVSITQAEVKFVFDKVAKPQDILTGSTDPRELAVAFNYIEFLDASNNSINKIAIGAKDTRINLISGWFADEIVQNTGETFVWAGGADKAAVIQAQIPTNTKYMKIRVSPLMANNSMTVSIDNKTLAKMTPKLGWNEITLKLDKSPSQITLTTSKQKLTLDEQSLFMGSLNPSLSNAVINLSITKPNGQQNEATTQTSADGSFTYSFKPGEKGDWLIQATWSGSVVYTGASSTTVTLNVSEATSSGGGIPGYPLESQILGLLISLAFLASFAKRTQFRSRAPHS